VADNSIAASNKGALNHQVRRVCLKRKDTIRKELVKNIRMFTIDGQNRESVVRDRRERRTMKTYFTEAGRIYLVRVENVVELAQSANNPHKQTRQTRRIESLRGHLAYLFRRMLIFLARGTCDTKRGSSGVGAARI